MSAYEDGSQDSQSKPAAPAGPESTATSELVKRGFFYQIAKAITEFFHKIQDSLISIPHFFALLGKYSLDLVYGLTRVAAVLLFMFYVTTCILRFWLWLVTTILSFARVLIRVLTIPLRRMAGIQGRFQVGNDNSPIDTSIIGEMQYELLVPALRFVGYVGGIMKTFWEIDVPRKLIAIILNIIFLIGPSLWVIPRTLFIKVIDPNALVSNQAGQGYLILAHDPQYPKIKFEFENENVLYLGKLNSPGLKAMFVTGKYYKIQVIGIRWYWPTQLFPNIISAEEVDANGNSIAIPEDKPDNKEPE